MAKESSPKIKEMRIEDLKLQKGKRDQRNRIRANKTN